MLRRAVGTAKDDSGTETVEYAMVVAVVLLAALVGYVQLGLAVPPTTGAAAAVIDPSGAPTP